LKNFQKSQYRVSVRPVSSAQALVGTLSYAELPGEAAHPSWTQQSPHTLPGLVSRGAPEEFLSTGQCKVQPGLEKKWLKIKGRPTPQKK